MRSINENSFSIPAWGVSLALHGGAVWLAVLFTAQVKPVITEDIFKWDVALVDAVKTDSISEPMPQPAQMEEAVHPVQPSPHVTASRPVEPPPDTMMHRVAPSQTVQMVHPEVQPTKPVEQQEDPLPRRKTEPVTPPVNPVREQTAEPIEQQVAEVPKTQPEPVTPAREPEPVQSDETVIAQPPSITAPPQSVESRPIETPAKQSALEPLASSAPMERAPSVSSPPNSTPQEAPMQTAKAVPGPDLKADHSWVGESLRRRVAELQRYPSSARLNGQEGKVVLKAVIRSDGHLAEVSVQKSSGHQILDAAAIELVKLACPLHMKHAMNTPKVVLNLPIVYVLAN